MTGLSILKPGFCFGVAFELTLLRPLEENTVAALPPHRERSLVAQQEPVKAPSSSTGRSQIIMVNGQVPLLPPLCPLRDAGREESLFISPRGMEPRVEPTLESRLVVRDLVGSLSHLVARKAGYEALKSLE